MTDKPKPLSRDEWKAGECSGTWGGDWDDRMQATLDALFEYRERTVDMADCMGLTANTVAAELGIE